MTARTGNPPEVVETLVNAELRALEAALRRKRQHAQIAWSLGGPAWPVVDWREALDRAVSRIDWITFDQEAGR